MTVQEVKTNKKDFNPNQMHSAHITDVEIYNTDASVISGIIDPATGSTGVKSDAKLQHFFEFAKKSAENSSKIVDKNGKPLVVYHGTRLLEYYYKDGHPYTRPIEKVTAFKDGKGYFTNDREAALDFANGAEHKVYATYLNIRNPKVIDFEGKGRNEYPLPDGRKVRGIHRDSRIIH